MHIIEEMNIYISKYAILGKQPKFKFTYIDGNIYAVVNYECDEMDEVIEVPSFVYGVVTKDLTKALKIAKNKFNSKSYIQYVKTIVLGENIKHIDKTAFIGFNSLKNIEYNGNSISKLQIADIIETSKIGMLISDYDSRSYDNVILINRNKNDKFCDINNTRKLVGYDKLINAVV